jgi:uncharacterized short protein YbdD (DUF466 family)
MNIPSIHEAPAPAPTEAISVSDDRTAGWRRLIDRGRALRQAYRQMFGIPDYERYVAHRASDHPDTPLLSRREFYLQSIDRKYGRSGPRCC